MDIRGIKGLAHCYLCTATKNSEVSTKTEYFSDINGASITSANRTINKDFLLGRSNPPEAVLNSLGMKETLGSKTRPLWEISVDIKNSAYRLPKVGNEERPVLPSSFDVFTASLISPNHLYYNDLSDLVHALFILLSTADRKHFELFFRIMVKQHGDYKVHTLLEMHFSDLFALSCSDCSFAKTRERQEDQGSCERNRENSTA